MVTARKEKSESEVFTSVEVVERPSGGTKLAWPIVKEAEMIAATLSDERKAIRLTPRNMEHVGKLQMALRHLLSKKDLVMRYRKDAQGRIVCWAEKATSKGGERA
jgi:hypothetical protein